VRIEDVRHELCWSGRCRHCLEPLTIVTLLDEPDDGLLPSSLACPHCDGDVCLEHDGEYA
jgi:hypothetical protein